MIINWEKLPHDQMIGHGREGLVLKLTATDCIKIYSPERAFKAKVEFENYQRLKQAGFLVPQPQDLVEIYIGNRTVKLPGKCEFRGIGLYNFQVESVPAIIKEFLLGIPYGRKKPNISEIKSLLDYLYQLQKNGFTFSDGIAPDFIATKIGAGLVDCSSLMNRQESIINYRHTFEEASSSYTRRILTDFSEELEANQLHFGFDLKLWLAYLISPHDRLNY